MILLKGQPLVLSALLIMILALIPDLPSWVIMVALVLGFIRVLSEINFISLPSRWLTNSLSVISLGLIYLEHNTLIGQEASSSMLVLLATLKMWETRSPRDLRFLQILGLALISVKYLFSYDLWIMIPTTISLLAILCSLITTEKPTKQDLTWLTKTMIVGLPLAVLLFVFFPRNRTPLYLGQRQSVGMIGFSGDLKPGSMSQLLQNSDLVLRIRFLDKQPNSKDFYFRGATLSVSEDLKWSRGSAEHSNHSLPQEDWQYEMIQEPHQNRWLFVLDGTSNILLDDSYRKADDQVFSLTVPQTRRITFKGQLKNSESIETADIDPFLQTVPPSEKLRSWIRSELEPIPDSNGKVQKIMDFLKDSGFRYSTSNIAETNLDQFFFETRTGYCEHYAGSVATILRLAKVPARVVLGYLGADLNPYGNFYYVTQSRAHAWVEYLDQNHRWVRIDPTMVIQPNLGQMLSQNDFWSTSWDVVQNYYLYLNFEWNRFLIEFDFSQQKVLITQYRKQILFGFLLLFSVFVLFSVLSLNLKKRKIPKPIRQWQEFERLMNRKGFKRNTYETPAEFVHRLPNQEGLSILNSYAAYRYSEKLDPRLVQLADLELKKLTQNKTAN